MDYEVRLAKEFAKMASSRCPPSRSLAMRRGTSKAAVVGGWRACTDDDAKRDDIASAVEGDENEPASITSGGASSKKATIAWRWRLPRELRVGGEMLAPSLFFCYPTAQRQSKTDCETGLFEQMPHQT